MAGLAGVALGVWVFRLWLNPSSRLLLHPILMPHTSDRRLCGVANDWWTLFIRRREFLLVVVAAIVFVIALNNFYRRRRPSG